MSKKKFFLLLTLVIFSIGGFIYSSIDVFTSLKTLESVLKLAKQYYVNPVNTEILIDNAIKAIADTLDAHTTYLKESDYKNLMIHTKGEFGGLGIRIAKKGDFITIISPIDDTPAYRAGILQGDKIIAIEGRSTKKMKMNKAVSIMRGKPGTDVDITISREGVEEPMDFTITRDVIKIKSIPYAGLLNDNVGYIKLTAFSKTTSGEMKKALDSLKNKGARKLILDLRGNPGGVLDEAVETASLFLRPGRLIVYTEGKKFHEQFESRTGGYTKMPLVVLVDAYSASGSEIVAGAVQDWDRGFLLGTRTFGKGSVQRLYPLPNKNALKLTIARYHTPSGRCIDRELVTDTTKTFHTKGNLNRVVKGGGGIIPDSTLLYDFTELFNKIRRKNIGFNFIVKYVNEHPDIKSVTPEMLDEFKDVVMENEVEFNQAQWDSSSKYIEWDLKRRLAYNRAGLKGMYRSMTSGDIHIETAMNILKKAESVSDVFSMR